MKKLFLILGLMLLISPVLAVENNFLVNVTTLPEWYLIDYGVGNAAIITNYNISNPLDVEPSNWTFYGSNDGIYFINLNHQDNVNFSVNTYKQFSVTGGPYRQYVLFLQTGFSTMNGHNLNLTLNASYVTPSSFVMTSMYGPATTTFDTNAFLVKWGLVIVGFILMIVGFKIPLSGILGVILEFIQVVASYSSYTFNEVLIISFISFIGLIVAARKVRG